MAVVEVGVGSKQAFLQGLDATGCVVWFNYSSSYRVLFVQKPRTSQNNYSQSDDLPLVHKCIVHARTLVMMIRVCHDEGSTSSLQQL